MRLVVFGLSISSSWGNGHATTYRGLLGALAARGWEITFFERDVEWYRSNRDQPRPGCCELRLYDDWEPATRGQAERAVRAADAAMIGSYVSRGREIVDWLASCERPLFFYDIDTPITLTGLRQGEVEYLRADQVPRFEAYFSFTGGPALRELETVWGARRAEALYCGVDSSVYRPVAPDPRYKCLLGYMGTYAPDRQPKLEALLIEPARRLPGRRFVVAGPQYPAMDLPSNVEHLPHVYPRDHAAFYSSCWATLNLTREAMVRYGWSPSVRLFEAAACGACIVSDSWPGLDELLEPGAEVLLVRDSQDVLRELAALTPERRASIGRAARARVLAEHTYDRRAEQVEAAVERALRGPRPAGGLGTGAGISVYPKTLGG